MNTQGPILLAHSYFLSLDAKQSMRMKPYPPLATLLIGALLRDRGHDVHLFDAMLATGVSEFHERLGAVRPSCVILVEDNFNFLTKMCTVRMRQAALAMIARSRRSGALVIVNGSDATDHPDLYLEAGAHAIVRGEPDTTVPALLNQVRDHGADNLAPVEGLILPAPDGGNRHTGQRPFLDALDHLPFPAWDLVDISRYRDVWTQAHNMFSWNMVTSRGCPYRCNWCAKPLFGTRYAQRSPANVADEMQRLQRDVRPDHIWFADDIFGLTTEWIEQFAAEVSARAARTPFTIQSRANLMKRDCVSALRVAGAVEVWLGVESGSQHILDAMDKGTTVEQIRTATRNLKAHHIRAGWFIQLGYLGERWEDILATRNLIRDERPDDVGVSVSYPLPGTKFYDMVQDQLGSKENWDDSDDLAMMFHGTYETSFYKRIRQLLHDEVHSGATPSTTMRRALDTRWEELESIEESQRLTLLGT